MSQFFINSNATPTPPVETIQVDKGGSVTGSTIQLYANSGLATLAGASVNFIARSPTQIDLDLTDLMDNVFLARADGNETLTGTKNVGIGPGALQSLTTGTQNICMGYLSCDACTTGSNNTSMGYDTLGQVVTGSNNIAFGSGAGNLYTSSESSNILFNHNGVVGESNTIRLGVQGSGLGQQNTCFIAGIVGVSNTNAQFVTINSATGQLGVTNGELQHYTATAISYQVLITDDIIGVTSNASARTITMPNSGMFVGQQWTIKDEAGTAQSSHNITISGNGANIDGSSTYVINTNFGAATLYFNGTNFFVI